MLPFSGNLKNGSNRSFVAKNRYTVVPCLCEMGFEGVCPLREESGLWGRSLAFWIHFTTLHSDSSWDLINDNRNYRNFSLLLRWRKHVFWEHWKTLQFTQHGASTWSFQMPFEQVFFWRQCWKPLILTLDANVPPLSYTSTFKHLLYLFGMCVYVCTCTCVYGCVSVFFQALSLSSHFWSGCCHHSR